MDPLFEISKEQWPELLDLFNGNGANDALATCTLKMMVIHPALCEMYNFKVYCPNGNKSKGIIATAYNTDQDSFRVMVFPLKDFKLIEDALRTTSVIDWKKSILLPSMIPEVVQCLEKIKSDKGVTLKWDDSSKAIVLVLKETVMEYKELSCLPNTYVGALKPEHIKLVDETWPYKGKYTYKYFETLMNYGLTYVLYSNDDIPLAWVSISPSGSLSHLYCVEEHRRKGYGEFIAKYATNEMLSKGLRVSAHLLENNVPAFKLFNSLGFENVGCAYFVFMYPNIHKFQK